MTTNLFGRAFLPSTAAEEYAAEHRVILDPSEANNAEVMRLAESYLRGRARVADDYPVTWWKAFQGGGKGPLKEWEKGSPAAGAQRIVAVLHTAG